MKGSYAVLSGISATAMILLAGIFCGCSALGYRLGTTLPRGISSIHVPVMKNTSRKPRIEDNATQTLISEFQRDGTLRIADRRGADTVIETVIYDYRLEPLRYSEDRSKTTSEYRLRIKARVVFKRTNPEQVLRRDTVEGESAFKPGNDLVQAERTALPEAVNDLAHNIVEFVVDYW